MTPTYISGFISFWITSVNVRSLKSCQAHNRHSISRNHCNYPSSSPCPTYPLYSTLLWSEKCPSGSPSPRAFLYITLYSFQASPSTWVFLLSISSRVILPPLTATLIPLGRCWSPLPWTRALYASPALQHVPRAGAMLCIFTQPFSLEFTTQH